MLQTNVICITIHVIRITFVLNYKTSDDLPD